METAKSLPSSAPAGLTPMLGLSDVSLTHSHVWWLVSQLSPGSSAEATSQNTYPQPLSVAWSCLPHGSWVLRVRVPRETAQVEKSSLLLCPYLRSHMVSLLPRAIHQVSHKAFLHSRGGEMVPPLAGGVPRFSKGIWGQKHCYYFCRNIEIVSSRKH